jgi:hypothetical protein
VGRADNLTTFMCRLSINSRASTSGNPKVLSRSVAGKLKLLLLTKYYSGDKIKMIETDRACSMYEDEERCTQGFSRES